MKPVVRYALETDAEQVATLMAQFEEQLRRSGDASDFQFTIDAYRRDGFGAEPAFAGLVAQVGDQIIGYLLYHPGYDVDSASRTLHIIDFYVGEKHRGEGVGAALMQYAQHVCREAGGKQLLFSVYKWNESARAFYERLGARCIEGEDHMCLELGESPEHPPRAR